VEGYNQVLGTCVDALKARAGRHAGIVIVLIRHNADGQTSHPLSKFWDKPRSEFLELLKATSAGLTSDEAQRRFRLYGPNGMVKESRLAVLISLSAF